MIHMIKGFPDWLFTIRHSDNWNQIYDLCFKSFKLRYSFWGEVQKNFSEKTCKIVFIRPCSDQFCGDFWKYVYLFPLNLTSRVVNLQKWKWNTEYQKVLFLAVI